MNIKEIWSRNRNLVFWLATALLSVNLARLGWNTFLIGHARADTASAYTVPRTEKSYDKNGKLWSVNYYITARRSDGSWMKRATTNDVQDREVFFANGQRVRLNELGARKSTYQQTPAGAVILRDSSNSCVTAQEKNSGWIISGQEDISGHPSVRVVRMLGQRRLTLWYSLELGCVILKQRLEHETGISDQELTAVIPGEPDTALFQVSRAFQEVPPSQLFDCSLTTGSCEPLPDSVAQRIDKNYYDAQ